MSATVIADRIGWSRGMTVLRDRILELRPLFLAADRRSGRSIGGARLAQFDLWQPDDAIPAGDGPFSQVVLGFSRFWGGWMVA
jgi:hypothetical protein